MQKESEIITEHHAEYNPAMAVLAGQAAVIAVTLMIIIKAWAYYDSGAASILASLTDSVGDAMISIMSYFAIKFSIKPADEEHRHGHGKIEGLAALFQGAFLSGASVFLLFEGLRRFANPHEITAYGGPMVIMAGTIVITLVLVSVQRYALKKAPSLAVEADMAHYTMDILTNAGALLVMAALFYGAPLWVDPLFAVGMAGYLAYTAWEVGHKAVDMLLDRELPDETRDEIKKIVLTHPEIKSFHDLRTRASGMKIYIYFDVEIDPDMSLKKAHAITLDVEYKLMKEFPNAEIMIHMDPAGISHKESRHHNVPDED